MRIALRTSGGRGEYELAGSQAEIKALDLVGYRIAIELLPGHHIQTGNIIRHTQGKPRIRLQDRLSERHAYLILADALLLPRPIREIGITPGGKLQLVDNKFSITSIQFEIIKVENTELLIYPTNIILSNSDDEQARIDVVERMRILLNAWSYADSNSDELSTLLLEQKASFFSGNEVALLNAAKKIRHYLDGPEDPLRQILTRFNLEDRYTYWMGLHTTDVEAFIIDEDLNDLREAARNRLRQWRLQAERGKEAIAFSSQVKQAYNNTCLFTGYYLPKIPIIGSAGIDSAHILPWAEYDLNAVNNGLCLSKLCHWAFDTGIIRLDFDSRTDEYTLTIPKRFQEAERDGQIALSPFHKITGPIPKSRLPHDRSNWPHPGYIKEYNDNIDKGL